MKINERQEKILEMLNENRVVGVKELAKHFNVSEMTIRRDLDFLEKNNQLTRTHGGGIRTSRVSFDLFMEDKLNLNRDAKKAIASRAVEFIKPHNMILLDVGTTILQMADYIKDIEGLTIATTSLAVASKLFLNQTARLIMVGGYIKAWSPELFGFLTEQNIRELHFDIVFLGANGIHPQEGLFCSDINAYNVIQEMIKSGDKVIVLADSSKVGKKSLMKYGDFGDIDILITDSRQPQLLEAMKDKVETIAVDIPEKKAV
jgi:DeoR/GlpR family transcriptional regulator of sugar metabolism